MKKCTYEKSSGLELLRKALVSERVNIIACEMRSLSDLVDDNEELKEALSLDVLMRVTERLSSLSLELLEDVVYELELELTDNPDKDIHFEEFRKDLERFYHAKK